MCFYGIYKQMLLGSENLREQWSDYQFLKKEIMSFQWINYYIYIYLYGLCKTK